MAEGAGKLRAAARAKFPRSFRFYDRHHATITAFGIIAVVAAVAYIGVAQRTTESTVTHIRGDVNVIKQQSACSPKKSGKPTNPVQCKRNFDTIIHKILTPLQACEFLERGAPLIQIGGSPIPHVECVRRQLTITPTLTPQSESPGGSADSGTTSGPVAGGEGGNLQGHQQQPSGSHHGSHGGGTGEHESAPESGGGSPGGSVATEEGTATTPAESSGGSAGGGVVTIPEEESKPSPSSLLPDIVKPVEETVCKSILGKIVCKTE